MKKPGAIKLWWIVIFIILVKSLWFDNMVQPLGMYPGWAIPILCLYSLPFIMLLLSPAFLYQGRFYVPYLLIIDLLASVILWADTLYFRAFDTPFTFYILLQTTCLEGLGNSIFSLIKLSDVIYIIDIPFLFFYLRRYPLNLKMKKFIAAAVLVSALGTVCLQLNNYILADRSQAVMSLSPLGYHAYDLLEIVNSQETTLTDQQRGEIRNWFSTNQGSSHADNRYKNCFKGKNIIAIQFESLETCLINTRIEGQEITPCLNRIITNSVYFPNIYVQVGDGNSADAELMFNTSLYPLRKGTAFFRYPHNIYPSLPMLLRENGYSTLAVHGDNPHFYNRDIVFPVLGYDDFLDETDLSAPEMIGMGVSDRYMFHETVSAIKGLPEPFYTFIITLTSHMPFYLPEKDKALSFSPPLDGSIMEDYLQAIHYADQALGTFLENMQRNGLMNNTIILIYGDHEGIHQYYIDKIDENYDLENNHRIPFIIYSPEMKGEEICTIGGQVDMFPTLAPLLGIDEEKFAGSVMGKNLLSTKGKGYAVLFNGDYVGEQEQREHQVKGLYISDLIITGSYFSEH